MPTLTHKQRQDVQSERHQLQVGPWSHRIRRPQSKHPLVALPVQTGSSHAAGQLKRVDGAETVVAKFHRTCLFGSTKLTLELRPGSEDILDMIVMTLVWVQWRQRLRMFSMVPTAAMLL